MLDANGISVTIPMKGSIVHPVRDVSLHALPGETVCIVGESGSGKSMTAYAVAGLLPRAARRTARSINICGEETRSYGRREIQKILGPRIGFVFQDPMTSLNPVLTVERQLIEGYVTHGRGSIEEARKRAIALLDRVGIQSPDLRLRQYPHELSGGLRQRVMIAMALMCSPALLIADEPTTALDVTTQAQILLLLKDIQREFGMAIVLITHDLGVVSAIGDVMYVMYGGQVVESGPVDQLLEHPLHPYLHGLLACVPGAGARGKRLSSIPGVVPLITEDLEGCAFRDRCAHAKSICASVMPALEELQPDHQVRCPISATSTGSVVRFMRTRAAAV